MKSICLGFCLIKIHEGAGGRELMRNIVDVGGVPDWDGRRKTRGWAHVSVDHVFECVCV